MYIHTYRILSMCRYVNLGWRLRDLVTVLEMWTTLLDLIDEEQQRVSVL